MRRFGEPVRRGLSYVHRPGVYALLPRAGAALLTFQDAPDPEFQLPGGGCDPGESPLTALHREVLEETGWRIAEPRRYGAYRRFVWMPEYELWAEKVCAVYVARPVRQIEPPREPGHTAVWAKLQTAVSLLAPPGDRILQAWLKGRRWG